MRGLYGQLVRIRRHTRWGQGWRDITSIEQARAIVRAARGSHEAAHAFADAVLDGRGRRSNHTLLLIRARDILLMESARFFPACSDRETARQLLAALKTYSAGRWRRDAALALCPPQYAGTYRLLFWAVLKLHDRVHVVQTVRTAAALARSTPLFSLPTSERMMVHRDNGGKQMTFEPATNTGPHTITTSTPSDASALLPEPAASKMIALKQRAHDLHSAIPEFADVRELAETKVRHQQRIQRLLMARAEGGFSLSPDAGSVVDERRKLERVDKELQRLQTLREVRGPRWTVASQLERRTSEWLLQGGIPHGCVIEAIGDRRCRSC